MIGHKLSLLLCYCHIIGICLLVYPSSVSAYAYSEKEISLLKVFIRTLFNEATGHPEAKDLWECSCGNKTYSDYDRRMYHRTAGILLWLWLDLPTAVKMTSLFHKAIESINNKNGVQLDNYIDTDSFVTILDKVNNELDNHYTLSDKRDEAKKHIDLQVRFTEKYYLKGNMLYKWKYWKQNPVPDFILHLDFINLASKEIDKCFEKLKGQQTKARIILYLAIDSTTVISDKMNNHYQNELFFARFTTNPLSTAVTVGQLYNCPLSDQTIDPLLYHFMTGLIDIKFDGTIRDTYNDVEEKIRKNPDYGSQIVSI